jgi:hypothetical protein
MPNQQFVCSIALVGLTFGAQSQTGSQGSPTPTRPDFVGEWQNKSPGMPLGGVPTITVTNQGDELKIQAWGRCVPQNCEWPTVRLWILRDLARQDPDRGFAVIQDKHLVLRIDGSELVVELYQTSDMKIPATRTRAEFVVMRYLRVK